MGGSVECGEELMLFTKHWAKIAVGVIAVVIAITFILATVASGATLTAQTSAATSGQPAAKFVSLLNSLKLDNKPTSHGGYQRSLFKLWIDADGNGCTTRAEVLMAESSAATTHSSTCTIRTGNWWSAYDDQWITAASRLDIDHFVPLSEAWKSGAYKWTAQRREAFANDLGYAPSLIAVSASTNRAKSDMDPAEWMPPNHAYWCTYAATWVSVKYRWALTVDVVEKGKLRSILATCGKIAIPLPSRA
jgi:hypothetical protein